MIEKVISGGQTGVDRAALDVAMKLNIKCGGWVPKGRKAEDGVIHPRYPMKEMESAEYADRTRQNIIDSDGTLILYLGAMSEGTKLTYELPKLLNKPYYIIDMSQPVDVEAFRDWVNKNFVRILNIGGPRASYAPGKIYPNAFKILVKLLS